jgi:hypothetical protein
VGRSLTFISAGPMCISGASWTKGERDHSGDAERHRTGYALIATHSGANLYTVTTDPEGAIYTGVTLDKLAQVYQTL